MRDSAIHYSRKDGALAPTWLLQRLCRPFKTNNTLDRVVSAFAFGGGLVNGGLSKDAMNLLGEHFRFDYMGSAEFEFGAVPAAFQHIAENVNKYVTHSFTIRLSEVAKDFRDKSETVPTGKATIYMIALASDLGEYEQRIAKWAAEPYNSGLKESTRLSSTLRPYHEWDGEVQGWLDLNNGIMFFTDRKMFDGVATLFGLDTSLVA